MYAHDEQTNERIVCACVGLYFLWDRQVVR